MPFNSSILKYDINRSNVDINNIIESAKRSENDSYIYSLLEFNDSVHDIVTIDKISYYRALTEASGNGLVVVDEGVVEVVKSLANIISKIITFLKDVSKKILNLNIFSKSRYNDLRKKNPKESKNSFNTIDFSGPVSIAK